MKNKEKTVCQCQHSVQIEQEQDWERRTKEMWTPFIRIDGVRVLSATASYRDYRRLEGKIRRLFYTVIAQGAAIIILALTQLLK